MKKKRPLLNTVLLILLFLFLLSFASSFDNIVSRKIAEWLNKPVEVIRDVAATAAVMLVAVILVFVAAAVFAAAPVVGIVVLVMAAVFFTYGLGKIVGWWGSSETTTKPENVKLDPKG